MPCPRRNGNQETDKIIEIWEDSVRLEKSLKVCVSYFPEINEYMINKDNHFLERVLI